MFDIDAGKLLILGVIALIVLGPKELPRVMRQVGAALSKMRQMAAEFQSQFSEAMKQSELEELKKDMAKMADQARVDINYDPVADTDRQMREAIDGKKNNEIPASTPIPEDPDPDNRVYTADLPAVQPSAAAPESLPASTAVAPNNLAEAKPSVSEGQPVRKAGEA
jgi:sec-independent protein translocase protein TatB